MRLIGVGIREFCYIVLIGFSLLLAGKSSVLAADISFCTETNLDSKITLLKLDLSMSYGEAYLNFKPVIDSEEYKLDFEKAVVNGKIGPALIETGIKDWIWGQEIMYVPTYPLQKDTSYYGIEGTLAWMMGHNLAIGAAQDRENSQILAKWLRIGFLFAQSDFTFVMSSDRDAFGDYTNCGGEFTYDFLNGLALYGGLNYCSNDTEQYSFGLQYLSKNDLMYTLEQYYNTDIYNKTNFIGLNINNYASIYGNWLGEIRWLYDLNDSGMLSVLKVKYNKYDKIVPSIEIYNYTGPNNSPMIFLLNAYDFSSNNQDVTEIGKCGMVLSFTVK